MDVSGNEESNAIVSRLYVGRGRSKMKKGEEIEGKG